MRYDLNTNTDQQKPIKQTFFGSLRRDTHWKCLILTLLILGCLVAISWCRLNVTTKTLVNFYEMSVTQSSRASPCDDGYVYIPVAFVLMLYLVYLVECWHSHTRIELQYKVDVNSVYEKIESMREALPIVWWKAICYHYVRRTRQVTRYRNGDAFTTTQVYYERVNSHTSSSAFNFSVCGSKDISKTLTNLDTYPATKIKFSKGFSFATVEAENDFEDQRAQFFQDHEQRDDYMETREGLDLLNVSLKEYMIAFADPHNLPWYVSHIVFWIASCLMLSWPLRVLIEYKTAYVHYHVHKLFGCNYLDPYCTGTMTRVSTMGSSELEMNIRNNYTMVPSYSEALLMDCASHNPSANGYIPLTGANIGHIPRSGSYNNGYMPLPLQSPTADTHSLMTTQNGHIVLQNGNGIVQASNHTTQSEGELTGYQMYSGVIQNPHAHTGYVVYQNGTVHIQQNNSLIPMGMLPHVQDYNVAPSATSRRRGGRLPSRHKRKRRKSKQQQPQEEDGQDQATRYRSEGSHAHSDSDTVGHSAPPIERMTRSHTLTLTPSHHLSSHLEYVLQDNASLDIGSDVTLPVDGGSDVTIPVLLDLQVDDVGEDTSLSISVSEDRGEHFERVEVHTSSTVLTEEIDSLPEDSGSPPDYEEALTMQLATSILQSSPINTLPNTQPARYNVHASEASTSSLHRPLTIKCMETSL